ncbi:MAG: hypothetical protein ACLPTF_20540 [Steroidobacteraceae bacterium]
MKAASHLSALHLLLRQFESPLVLGSTLLGFYKEYKASAAVEDLKRRLALTCRVVRGGLEQTVPVSAIVPGDVILLSAGNLIPADGRVIEAADFQVNEASLTGESFPVEKQPGIVPPETPVAGRTNAVYLGASVQSGEAKMLAVETGSRTAFGAIVERLKGRPPETEFERGIRQFGYLLIRVMIAVVLFVLTVNLLLGRPLIESLLFAVALAVGLTRLSEELPFAMNTSV